MWLAGKTQDNSTPLLVSVIVATCRQRRRLQPGEDPAACRRAATACTRSCRGGWAPFFSGQRWLPSIVRLAGDPPSWAALHPAVETSQPRRPRRLRASPLQQGSSCALLQQSGTIDVLEFDAVIVLAINNGRGFFFSFSIQLAAAAAAAPTSSVIQRTHGTEEEPRRPAAQQDVVRPPSWLHGSAARRRGGGGPHNELPVKDDPLLMMMRSTRG